MTIKEFLSILALNTGVLIFAVIGLVKWLGELTAKRILQKEQGQIIEGIEELKKELDFIKSNYEKNSDWIIEFYSMFYRHYQLAQLAANWDIRTHPEEPDMNIKEHYKSQLSAMAEEWNKTQGVARIRFPKELLELHNKAIDKFNTFKDAIVNFNHTKEAANQVENCFMELNQLKDEMENEIRIYLRSEKI